MDVKFRFAAFLFGLIAVSSLVFGQESTVVFRDGFESLPPGAFSRVMWARGEFHYLPESEPKGNWTVACYSSQADSQRAWKVIEHSGRRGLLQTYTPDKDKHTHPLVLAGDPLWRDYTLTVRFQPLSDKARSGVVFRCENSRRYYFFGVEGSRAVLKKIDHEIAFRKPNETLLAQAEDSWEPGAKLVADITVLADSIRAGINGKSLFEVKDASFPAGRIGLTSDTPTRFLEVSLSMTTAEKSRVEQAVAERTRIESELQAAQPSMKLWKRFPLKDFGVGRNLRLGDLDNDGDLDILIGQIRHHGPKDRFSELSCLTALTTDGKTLWQLGEPDVWKDHLTNDVAMQIHDIDGDGKTEVVYTMNQEIVVADGATGTVKLKHPTPVAIPDEKNPAKFPRILGDSLFFADLRGRGRADHLLLKDRYTNFWVLDAELRTLWYGNCRTGHYPYPRDIDGDGREELFVGYSLFEDDGTKVWSLDPQVQDHADALTAVTLKPDRSEEVKILCAASDEGFYVADLQGKIHKHYRLGHVQNISVANFRNDLEGLEVLTMNYWGNQGIAHVFNSDCELIHSFNPCNHGSVILPVNWNGSGEEFFVLSANVARGGLYDVLGRCVLQFPADGHPDMCFLVQDLTGDPRDEIIVWDPFELWIYTQSDSPRPEKIYAPRRNPTYNMSNYRATVSYPEWQEKVPSK